jgi:hypothetical protein
MYVCVYVCMYVCLYVCMCVRTYVCIYIYICMYIYIDMSARLCVCVCVRDSDLTYSQYSISVFLFLYPHGTVRNITSTATLGYREVPLILQAYFFEPWGKAAPGCCTLHKIFLFSQIKMAF